MTDFQFRLSSSFFQMFVNMMHGSILKAVKQGLGQAKTLFQGKIDYINKQLASHNSSAFMLNLVDPRFPLNLTTTRSPILDGSSQIITLDFEGTIYDSIAKTDHVTENAIFPQRVTDSTIANSH